MIREPHENDAEALCRFFVQLDQETRYMLFEPGERAVDIDGQRAFLHRAREDQNPLILVAEQNGAVVGFCGLRRETLRKNRQCASLVVGLLAAHRGQGLGEALVRQNLDRARAAGVTRVELTVVEENFPARALYRKLHFEEEGLRRRSLLIDGRYHAEVWMGLLLTPE